MRMRHIFPSLVLVFSAVVVPASAQDGDFLDPLREASRRLGGSADIYLIGNATSVEWLGDGEEPRRVPADASAYDVTDLRGFPTSSEAQECRDRRDKICVGPLPCLPKLCPPSPLPRHPDVEGKLEGLHFQRAGDRVTVRSSAAAATFFLVVSESTQHVIRSGERAVVAAPATVYRLRGLGHFGPEFTSVESLRGGLPFQPCSARDIEKGLCGAEEAER